MAFIYREEVEKKDREDLRGKAELIIEKSRNGRPKERLGWG